MRFQRNKSKCTILGLNNNNSLFQVWVVVRGESPGCRLFSTASLLEWLRNLLPPLTGEQYGKMEPKYPEDGHCQSVLRPRVFFNIPLYFK